MRKLKKYNQFLNEDFIEAKLNAEKVEKKIYDQYSDNFWKMALKSRMFEDYEKDFIKEELITTKLDLNNIDEFLVEGNVITKGIDWLRKKASQAYDYLAKKGKEAMDWFVDKLKKLRDGIKWIVNGIKSWVMKMWTGLIKYVMKQAKKMGKAFKFDKESKKMEEKLAEEIQKNPEAVALEAGALSSLLKWMGLDKHDEISSQNSMTNSIDKKTEEVYDSAQKAVEETIAEVEKNAKDDSEFDYIDFEEGGDEGDDEGDESGEEKKKVKSQNEDMLYNLYNYGMVCEGAAESGEKKSAFTRLMNWIGKFIGNKNKWEGSIRKKLGWLFSLLCRILGIFLNPILFIIKKITQAFSKNILEMLSWSCSAVSSGKFNLKVLKQIPGEVASHLKNKAKELGQWFKDAGEEYVDAVSKLPGGMPAKESLRQAQYQKINEGAAITTTGDFLGVKYVKFAILGSVVAYSAGLTVDALTGYGYISKIFKFELNHEGWSYYFIDSPLFKTMKEGVAHFFGHLMHGALEALGIKDTITTLKMFLTCFCTFMVFMDLLYYLNKAFKAIKLNWKEFQDNLLYMKNAPSSQDIESYGK